MLPGRTNNHMLKLMQDYKVFCKSIKMYSIMTFRENSRTEWFDALQSKFDSSILIMITIFCMSKKTN